MSIELKICGINSENIIQTIIQNGGCQYLGFVFYPPSPRNLTIEQSEKLTSIVPEHIKKVAVLVKPESSFVEKIKNQFNDYYRRKELTGADILCDTRRLSFVNNIILEIPSIITIKEKREINELYEAINNEQKNNSYNHYNISQYIS